MKYKKPRYNRLFVGELYGSELDLERTFISEEIYNKQGGDNYVI